MESLPRSPSARTVSACTPGQLMMRSNARQIRSRRSARSSQAAEPTKRRCHGGAPADRIHTLVTGGIEAALGQARAAAGNQDVRIMGGASLGQQFLAAGLVDEIVLHVVPVLLKGGIRMFDKLGPGHVGLEVLDVINSTAATHLRYRVTR